MSRERTVKVSMRGGDLVNGKLIEVTALKTPGRPSHLHDAAKGSGVLIMASVNDDGVLVVDVYRPDGNVEVRLVTPEYNEAARANGTVEIKARLSRAKS